MPLFCQRSRLRSLTSRPSRKPSELNKEENSMRISAALLLLFVSLTTIGQTGNTTTIKLYFPNTKLDKSDCAVKVFPITRKIPKTGSIAKASLEQLFAGPTAEEQEKGYYSDFSEETIRRMPKSSEEL